MIVIESKAVILDIERHFATLCSRHATATSNQLDEI
jgi:hypothetical protein